MLSAAGMAQAPGMATTSMPLSTARRTRMLPGSLMQGVPASVVRATLMPSSCMRATMACAFSVSLCSWQLVSGV